MGSLAGCVLLTLLTSPGLKGDLIQRVRAYTSMGTYGSHPSWVLRILLQSAKQTQKTLPHNKVEAEKRTKPKSVSTNNLETLTEARRAQKETTKDRQSIMKSRELHKPLSKSYKPQAPGSTNKNETNLHLLPKHLCMSSWFVVCG